MPRALSQPFSVLFLTRLEPAVGVPLEEVQEQQRLAEAVGGLHQLLPVLLQDPPGQTSVLCSHCSVIRRLHSIRERPVVTLTHECWISVELTVEAVLACYYLLLSLFSYLEQLFSNVGTQNP